jgi:hypothetical protein
MSVCPCARSGRLGRHPLARRQRPSSVSSRSSTRVFALVGLRRPLVSRCSAPARLVPFSCAGDTCLLVPPTLVALVDTRWLVTGSNTRSRGAGQRSSCRAAHRLLCVLAEPGWRACSFGVWSPAVSRTHCTNTRCLVRWSWRHVAGGRRQSPAVVMRCTSAVGGALLCVVHSSAKAFHLRSALRLTHQPRTATLCSFTAPPSHALSSPTFSPPSYVQAKSCSPHKASGRPASVVRSRRA